MTVAELMAALSKMPADAETVTFTSANQWGEGGYEEYVVRVYETSAIVYENTRGLVSLGGKARKTQGEVNINVVVISA